MTEPGYCRAHDVDLLCVTGRDARQFLHAQTTQDLTDFGADETRLAAWLTPKGRVRALFDIVAGDDMFWLVVDGGSAEWLAGELGRFVLRSDVSLKPAGELAVFSLVGDSGAWLESRGIAIAIGQAIHADDLIWFQSVPGRIDVIGAPNRIEPLLADLPRADTEVARQAAIAAGRPALPEVLRDRYIPQMLNLDRLGAVSFTKGCYPGQEIVARTQNLGEVKRRLARYRVAGGPRPQPDAKIVVAQPVPASEPFTVESVPDQSVPSGESVATESVSAGEVNRAAATDAGFELLAVTRVDAAGTRLSLASDGRPLTPLPLPAQNSAPAVESLPNKE